MSNLIDKLFAVILCTILFLGSSANAQSLFTCGDTPYNSNIQPSILKSKYHLIQIFGDNTFRTTNFFKNNYSGMVAWVEGRLFFARFSEFINTYLPLPDPYLTGILTRLKDIDWEDRIDYGIGIEWRPLKHNSVLQNTPVNWLYHIRFYAVYFKTVYLQFRPEWTWRPNDDLRFGLELYRECNLYYKDIFWQEIWADVSWRKTNFFINDFNDWVFTFVPKWGLKFFPKELFALMPYLTGEFAITGRREFWQNRAIVGIGLRIMPFRRNRGVFGIFMRGIRIYIEGLKVIKYLKDKPPKNTPDFDIRFGFNYTIYRW